MKTIIFKSLTFKIIVFVIMYICISALFFSIVYVYMEIDKTGTYSGSRFNKDIRDSLIMALFPTVVPLIFMLLNKKKQ